MKYFLDLKEITLDELNEIMLEHLEEENYLIVLTLVKKDAMYFVTYY